MARRSFMRPNELKHGVSLGMVHDSISERIGKHDVIIKFLNLYSHTSYWVRAACLEAIWFRDKLEYMMWLLNRYPIRNWLLNKSAIRE